MIEVILGVMIGVIFFLLVVIRIFEVCVSEVFVIGFVGFFFKRGFLDLI